MEKLYATAWGDYSCGRYQEAMKIFLGLTILDSTQARFLKGCGACMQMLGHYRQASLSYANAYALTPEDSSLLFHLAQCFWAAGGRTEASEVAARYLSATKDANGDDEMRRHAAQMINAAANARLKE